MRLRLLAALLIICPAAALDGDVVPLGGRWPVLQAGEAGWTAVGRAYKASMEGGRVTFTPSPAAPVERNQSVAWSLESVRVGAREVPLDAAPSGTRISGLRAEARRGPGVREVYDAREEGVELSFVFDELPDAEGDLTVRLALDSVLPAPAPGEHPDGLAFLRAGVAGVRIGAVTGLDAAGRVVPGTLRFDGGALELVLPAELVEHRAYPIVLDPLISIFPDLNPFGDQRSPDVAYDEDENVYLVVWQRRYSSSDNDVYAQRVAPDGSLVGGSILLESSIPGNAMLPAVGNAAGSGRFLVVWQYDVSGVDTIVGRSVTAAGGTYSNQVTVASSAGDALWPDVNSNSLDDTLIVVWEQDGSGIQGRRMEVPVFADPFPFAPAFAISSNANDARPAIAEGSTGTSNYLVVWQRWYSTPAPGDHDLWSRLVNIAGVNVSTGSYLAGDIGPDEKEADVDGNGTEWLVAYDKDPVFGSFDGAVYATSYEDSFSFSGVREFDVLVDDVEGVDDSAPAVAYTGEAFVVAYRSRSFADSSQAVRVRTMDGHCLDCGDAAALDGDFLSLGGVSIASQWSGVGTLGPAPDEAFVAYQTHDTGGSVGVVNGASWQTDTGSYTYILTDCGEGGIPSAPCASVGNASFTHRLSAAEPFVPAWLVIGLSELGIGCGGGVGGGGECVLSPNPADGFVLAAGTTDAFGRASVTTPLSPNPAFVGLTFTDQWVVEPGATGCPLFGTDLSDGLRITLE